MKVQENALLVSSEDLIFLNTEIWRIQNLDKHSIEYATSIQARD